MIVTGEARILAVVGMVKNAGKTTFLNSMVEEAEGLRFALGLTSIGHDGEARDQLTHKPKPAIRAPRGAIIATARGKVEGRRGLFEILAVTDRMTAFGPVVITRLRYAADVELIGPRSSLELKATAEDMLAWGADRVLIDGALDRMSSASPSVADAVWLVTGAAVSRDPREVARRTGHRVRMMQLPGAELDETLRQDLLNLNEIAAVETDGTLVPMDCATGIGAGIRLASRLTKRHEQLFLPGALTDQMAGDLLRHLQWPVRILIRDGTRAFLGPRTYADIREQGSRIEVLETIRLAGVAVNPVALQGYALDSRELIRLVKEACGNLPVVDVVRGDHDVL